MYGAYLPRKPRKVLVLGSGGLVHNLGLLDWADKYAATAPWARAFDAWVAELPRHVAG